jgi:class 3 adenylate cyclase
MPGTDHLIWLDDADAILAEIEEFLTGARGTPDPDRVLATVLFTDIVGATEKATALGDRRWHDLLDSHNAVVRRELSRFRGREVNTAGDGFFAVFDGPARAVRCAGAISHAVRSLGLDIRAGLHTGECEVMGADIGGIAVHIGARIAARAGPGEVLVSSTVKDLVAGSGLSFRDQGTTLLKGVSGEWRLYSAEA